MAKRDLPCNISRSQYIVLQNVQFVLYTYVLDSIFEEALSYDRHIQYCVSAIGIIAEYTLLKKKSSTMLGSEQVQRIGSYEGLHNPYRVTDTYERIA